MKSVGQAQAISKISGTGFGDDSRHMAQKIPDWCQSRNL